MRFEIVERNEVKHVYVDMQKSCRGNAQPSITISLLDLSIISALWAKRENIACGKTHPGLWHLCIWNTEYRDEWNSCVRHFKVCLRVEQNSYLLVDLVFVEFVEKTYLNSDVRPSLTVLPKICQIVAKTELNSDVGRARALLPLNSLGMVKEGDDWWRLSGAFWRQYCVEKASDVELIVY